MAIVLSHLFNCAIATDPAATAAGQLTPARWNEQHSLAQGGQAILGKPDAGDGATTELTLGTGLGFNGTTLENTAPSIIQPGAATLTNNLVATTETIVARWLLPANAMATGRMFDLDFLGQVSSTATLIFRVRIGTAGTTSDALAATFATSAAGVANGHVSGDIKIAVLSSTTACAGGQIQVVNAVLGPASAAFAAATITPASALYVSVTLVQSAAQTYTSRAAVLTRVI